MVRKLSTGELANIFDEKKLDCKTTEELEPLEGIIGQDRAVKALEFGLNIDEGIEILTGVKAGIRKADGSYEEGTVNCMVDKRIKEFLDKLKIYFDYKLKDDQRN